MLGRRFEYLWNHLLRRWLRCPEDVPIHLSDGRISKGGLLVPVKTFSLWLDEPWWKKILTVVTLHWSPSQEALECAALEVLQHEVFGCRDDLGPWLLNITHWRHSQDWGGDILNDEDSKRADAIDTFTTLTRRRLSERGPDTPLNLGMAQRTPSLMFLPFAMCIKVPVISFQYFLDVDARFAFTSIRKANHPQADGLISYLYELLYLQQKTAIGLHEYVHLFIFTRRRKDKALLLNAEVDSIMKADLIFSYLKASIEKTMALIGLVYGITNIDAKKNHAGRLKTVLETIPQKNKSTPYGAFLLEFLKAENFDELNSYRSGLLHKKGIADLQPHNYIGKEAQKLPFVKVVSLLHEQHAKNTGILVSALALLTDDLVARDPPLFSPQSVMSEFAKPLATLSEFLAQILKEEDGMETAQDADN